MKNLKTAEDLQNAINDLQWSNKIGDVNEIQFGFNLTKNQCDGKITLITSNGKKVKVKGIYDDGEIEDMFEECGVEFTYRNYRS